MYWTGTQHLLCPLCLPSSLFPPPSTSLPTFRLPSHLLPEEYGNLQKGDEIIEINGVPIRWQNQEEVRICSGYEVHGWVCMGCVSGWVHVWVRVRWVGWVGWVRGSVPVYSLENVNAMVYSLLQINKLILLNKEYIMLTIDRKGSRLSPVAEPSTPTSPSSPATTPPIPATAPSSTFALFPSSLTTPKTHRSTSVPAVYSERLRSPATQHKISADHQGAGGVGPASLQCCTCTHVQ